MTTLRITTLNLPASQTSPMHAHEEGQFFYLQSGAISLCSEHHRHLFPPGCIAWVPPWLSHGASVHQNVSAQRWYVDAEWAHLHLPKTLKIVRATVLLHQLIQQLSDLYHRKDAAYSLYLDCFADQFKRQPNLPLSLAMPSHPRLLQLCQQCLAEPGQQYPLDQLADSVCMSRRSFTRHFVEETGSSFGAWLRQMRSIQAMEKLAQGEPVTPIALDLGYNSVSAFTHQFRRHVGMSPKLWLRQSEGLT